ncbi:hypothetical protein [Massilia aquatica]|uniref:YbbD head domain-containing protein n=1 Tax=Massilia aquatica TaxID=2609000 RepID=A0ABX0MEK2_9BURK|nr:hypothetical protein [Massilia aquatica]NHZ41959.1 hypothetical protein [Massilia aquatica]
MTALLALFLYIMPGSEVGIRYPTLLAARADKPLDRGWLPAILPPSTTGIRIINNPDLNTSSGDVDVHPAEYRLIMARSGPYRPIAAPYDSAAKTVENMREDDDEVRILEDEESLWVFFCKGAAGHCNYMMWSRGI